MREKKEIQSSSRYQLNQQMSQRSINPNQKSLTKLPTKYELDKGRNQGSANSKKVVLFKDRVRRKGEEQTSTGKTSSKTKHSLINVNSLTNLKTNIYNPSAFCTNDDKSGPFHSSQKPYEELQYILPSKSQKFSSTKKDPKSDRQISNKSTGAKKLVVSASAILPITNISNHSQRPYILASVAS